MSVISKNDYSKVNISQKQIGDSHGLSQNRVHKVQEIHLDLSSSLSTLVDKLLVISLFRILNVSYVVHVYLSLFIGGGAGGLGGGGCSPLNENLRPLPTIWCRKYRERSVKLVCQDIPSRE